MISSKLMKSGRVEIILGCMFSGKSTELIHRISKYEAILVNTVVINHVWDTRVEDDAVRTHSGHTRKALKLDKLVPWIGSDEYNSAEIIGIDEAQFFDDLLDFVKLSEKDNKIIIIAGLDGDFKREPFGQILYCIPLCDEVIKLNAMDMISKDGTPAIFSKRICADTEQTSIGAGDKYVAVSRFNYLKDS